MAGRYLYLVEQGAGLVAAVREAAALAISEHANLETEAHGGIVASTDGRLTDARAPTAHKGGHATGAADAIAPSDIGAAASARTVSTTAPLTGGGDLSANRTLGLENVTGLTPGTYERAAVTVDAKGRVTSVQVGTAGTVADASETAKGAVELATAAEIQAGTVGVLVPSAARLKAELDRRGVVEDWSAPTLTNNWANVAGTDNATAGYYKNGSGEVFVKGRVGGGAVGTVIFVLPVGYRPSQTMRYAVDSFNGTSLVHGSVHIRTDGAVQHVTGGTVEVHTNLPAFRAA